MLSRDYKEKFSLPYNMALISKDIIEKKSLAVKNNPTWKENFKKSFCYRFPKGHTGYRRISKHEMNIITQRINAVNYKKKIATICPICRIKYYHLESHLFNKHGFIKVINKKG